MKVLNRRSTLALACAAATLTLSGQALAQTVTLRLHQMLPAQDTIPAKALLPWAQKVEKESGGKI